MKEFPRGPLLALAAFILVGTVVGALWPVADWSILRRGVAGAFMGGWCGLLLTASRLLR